MDADLTALMTTGLIAIIAGTIILVLLLRGDLLPASSLEGGGRWFLGAALGIGIIVFTIKLIIISTIVTFPKQTISPLLSDRAARKATALSDVPEYSAIMRPIEGEPTIWQALPTRAPDPANNPTTPEKVTLGEKLFFDTNLSKDRTIACASCHSLIEKAGADGLPTAIGITRTPGSRNAPTVWNAAFQRVLFWDGRAHSLEEQAGGPPLNPIEMGMPSNAAIEERVKADPAYKPMFARAFGENAPITIEQITMAIAAYERTLITPDTPYDRFVHGEEEALTAAQKRGMWLFQSTGCVTCHSGPNFSSASVFGQISSFRLFPANDSPYKARYRLTDDKGMASTETPVGVWRVPSLRNVALTAPYFHNGSVNDLREAIRVMATSQLNVVLNNEGIRAQPFVWHVDRKSFDQYRRRVLSDKDIDDIAAFLDSLTSDRLRAKVSSR